MIYAIGIFLAFFLSVLVFTKKRRTLADSILGVWLMVIGTHAAFFYAHFTGVFKNYPFLLGVDAPFPFLHCPIFYLYTIALTYPERFKNKHWLGHFLIPCLIYIYLIPLFITSIEYKIYLIENGIVYKTANYFLKILMLVLSVFYLYSINELLDEHKKRILNHFSNQEKVNLDWLRFIYYLMCVIWFVVIFIGGNGAIFIAVSLFVVSIGYFGINQTGVFTNIPFDINELEKDKTEDSEDKKKYANSGLNEEAGLALHEQLNQIMRDEKLFLNPELNLTDLATQLNTHPNYLSQILNEKVGLTFYDYVNTLRLEEFKLLAEMPENQKYTLLALAYQCGFNSKTSFNRNFKKLTDQSPSQYLKALNIAMD
jgi:AraC-like DNA-binding protein